jgi:hypothetical protein
MINDFIFAVALGFLLYFNMFYNPWIKHDAYRNKTYSADALKEVKQLVVLVHILVAVIVIILIII